MSDKKEIKSYSTAFFVSLAVHALILLLIVIFSKTTFNAHKIVVIDLTLMDPVTAEAGVSGNKNPSDVYEPKRKHQKAAVRHVKPEIRHKKQDVKEEKAETDVKVTQDFEPPQVDEQIPAVKTVSLAKDTKQNFAFKGQKGSKRAGTSLPNTSANESTSLKGKGVPIEDAKDAVGSGSAHTDGVMKGYLRSHLSDIKDLIQENIAYPETARREGWTGKVTVSFVIAHNGSVRDIEVVRSSSFSCLDKNAVEAVERSSPFPHPPAEARIIIPILYTLH
jgi:protein TonB